MFVKVLTFTNSSCRIETTNTDVHKERRNYNDKKNIRLCKSIDKGTTH